MAIDNAAIYNSSMPVGERRLLEQVELWPQERALCAKAAEGGLLDLRSRRPREDDPARGREWGRSRQIRAQVLFQLLTGQGPSPVGEVVAVRLRGAQIVGRLNLGGLSLRCPLELYDCYLGGRLDLAKAEAPNLSLRSSYLRERLSARQLRLTHILNLSKGFRCSGRVDLACARVSGLNCEGATLANPGGQALNAEGLTVGGDMFLPAAKVTGQVCLAGAHIKGQLDCDGATFTYKGGRALDGDRLTVGGDLFLRGATVTGEIWLASAHIGSWLDCRGATLTNEGGQALTAEGLTVGGDMFLPAAKVTGQVWLAGAHIKGQLDCDGATFTDKGEQALYALYADRLTVGGDLSLRGATVTGGMWLASAQIDSWLDCRG
jgi:hypothetical protein